MRAYLFLMGTSVKYKNIFPKRLLNQAIQIFVPEDDTVFDMVFGVTEVGDTYKIDFGGRNVKTSLEASYSKSTIDYKKGVSDRFNNAFLKLLSLSIFSGVLRYFLMIANEGGYWFSLTKISFCFLILYRILRFPYIRIYDREPVYDKYAKRFEDFIFYFLLSLGIIFLSIFI